MPKILDAPREHIMEASKQELARDGVAGFNIRDVAKGSGVAIGTIYNYYGNKTSLIASTIRDNWRLLKEECEAKVDSGDRVELTYDAIKKFFDANLTYFKDVLTSKIALSLAEAKKDEDAFYQEAAALLGGGDAGLLAAHALVQAALGKVDAKVAKKAVASLF